MAASIILLGDSIFDNAPYVINKPCVTDQLREITPDDVGVSLFAVDGDFVKNVKTQLERVPEQATHLFVSAGGNDALSYYQELLNDYRSSESLFEKWSEIQADFKAEYRAMLERVRELGRHTAVCTIYDSVPDLEQIAITALSFFNDAILSEAITAGLPVVDLRQVCTEREDYSHLSPIEPSFQGGGKIARALNHMFTEHDFSSGTTRIYS